MTAIPKSQAAATALLEEYADLGSRVALIEEDRSIDIAAANQRADVAATPMLQRMAAISASLESWWPSAALAIANGKKSVQLGGCIIGSRMSKAKLAHTFDTDEKAAIALFKLRSRKHTTNLKVTLNKVGTVKLLQIGGKTADEIAELGFAVEPGSDQFFVERVQQDRTIGS